MRYGILVLGDYSAATEHGAFFAKHVCGACPGSYIPGHPASSASCRRIPSTAASTSKQAAERAGEDARRFWLAFPQSREAGFAAIREDVEISYGSSRSRSRNRL